MRANTEELNIFITVVQSGSFTKAASVLQVDNSVVSRAVKKLEQKLGVTLLNRTTRQLNLTEEGAVYYEEVYAAMSALANAESVLRDAHHKPSGLLRIDAAIPVILHYVAPFVAAFKAQYPLIELYITSSETYINLIEQKVDVAIRVGALTDSSLKASPLFSSYRKMVCAPAYVARKGRPKDVADLKNHECLAFTTPQSLNTWPVMGQDDELCTIQPALSASSGEIIRELCLQGNGIACLSDFAIDKDIQGGRLIELFAEERVAIEMPFNAVYYSESGPSSKIRAFIDFMKAQAI